MERMSNRREEGIDEVKEPMEGKWRVLEDKYIDEFILVCKDQNKDGLWLNKTVQNHGDYLSNSRKYLLFQKNISSEILLKLIVVVLCIL